MSFWKSFKPGKKEEKGSQIQASQPEPSGHAGCASEYLWLALLTGRANVFLGHDLVLCANERGELTGFILPDSLVSWAKSETVYGKSAKPMPFVDIGIIQRISYGKDESCLLPLGYTQEQVNKITNLISSYNRGELSKELKKTSWSKLFSEVRSDNAYSMSLPSLHQSLQRVKIVGNDDPTRPDDAERIKGSGNKFPIFMYTTPGNNLEFDSDRLHRELLLRHVLAQESLTIMRDTLAGNPIMSHWLNDIRLAEYMGRAQAELLMNSEAARPPSVPLVLNPDMSELILEPELQIRPKPEWEIKRHGLKPPMKSWFSEINFDDPNILQIILHVGELEAMTSPEAIADSVTSPAITIFRDELGVHTLATYLFHISTQIYEMEAAQEVYGTNLVPSEPRDLDKTPSSQIPEIRWQPVSGRVLHAWWQDDSITKKVLWLATRNLCSHLVGERRKVVCAVTPMGENTVQVGIALGDREQGTPYAYAVVKGETEVNAVPIFPTGAIEQRPDGSAITRANIVLKNYTITTKGERRLEGLGHKMFVGPIYSTILRGRRIR